MRFRSKNHERRFAFVNKRMAEILGRPVPEVLGHTLEEFQPTEISAPIYEDDTSVMSSGVAHTMEERLIVEGNGVRTFQRKGTLT